jgi:GntR family transcriptional regulator
VRAEQTMEASLANARELELLQMTPPASVLRIERFTYNQQDILLEYVISAYRGDLYKFRLSLQ